MTSDQVCKEIQRISPEGMEEPTCSGTNTYSKNKDDLKDSLICIYCNQRFHDEGELNEHCQTELHQATIMSDIGREWKFRDPPRGFLADQYVLCSKFSSKGTCTLGQQCSEAHGEAELAEWQERLSFRQMKFQQAKERRLHGSMYAEQLIEMWMQSPNPEKVMKTSVDGVKLHVDTDLNVTISSKCTSRDWTFCLVSKVELRQVALLYDIHRAHFSIVNIKQLENDVEKSHSVTPHCQEWVNMEYLSFHESTEFQYKIKVTFATSVFGTFRQAVVFDFGTKPVLFQKLCVDVVPVENIEKLEQVKEVLTTAKDRWDSTNVIIHQFPHSPHSLTEEDHALLSWYPPPNISKFIVTQSVMEPLTKENYVPRLHDLLYVEEMAHFKLISKYNICGYATLVDSYLLTHTSLTSKYAQNGELYACLKLSSQISEDFAPGRLILTNCNTALVGIPQAVARNKKVYEALIEDKGKNTIYLRLSSQCVSDLKLRSDMEVLLEVQFQLNRLPLCEMHFAVDKLSPIDILFPDVDSPLPPDWNAPRTMNPPLNSRLNPKQKEAIMAITADIQHVIPPILILGPFGTGKTFTLAESVKQIASQPNTRVLICTHSNSAADLYIKEHLHPYVAEGHPEARPLRVYYQHRWIATVNEIVLQYCLLSSDGQNSFFVLPTLEDIKKHRIIITTLSMSRVLVQLGLQKGFFSHILIDEAAQSMECETILALSLATRTTRIVLTGDHMQLNPEVYSPFAQQRNLHVSLLERLHELYPLSHPCKILLSQNYRSHRAIINYTSELFYENNLVASGDQPGHCMFFPLTFFTAQGEDVQDINSTAYHNDAEVYEVVDRVKEIKDSWPAFWGKADGNIGVVTPYYDQVVRIRQVLRKKKINGVSVERVFNVQGKQFRAIILSTVRTRHTAMNSIIGTDGVKSELDLGFLSNAKLLNTAITRAQSLVAVVGDPVSLCSVGKCRKLWERFIQIANMNNALHGIHYDSLRNQLDSLELKKTYTLNPLAPEFFPRNYFQNPAYQQTQPQQSLPSAVPNWAVQAQNFERPNNWLPNYNSNTHSPAIMPSNMEANMSQIAPPLKSEREEISVHKQFIFDHYKRLQVSHNRSNEQYQERANPTPMNTDLNKVIGRFPRITSFPLTNSSRSPFEPLPTMPNMAANQSNQQWNGTLENVVSPFHSNRRRPGNEPSYFNYNPQENMLEHNILMENENQQRLQQSSFLRQNYLEVTPNYGPVEHNFSPPSQQDTLEKIIIIRRNIPRNYDLKSFLESPYLQLNYYLALQRNHGAPLADKFLKYVDWIKRNVEPSNLNQICTLVDSWFFKEFQNPKNFPKNSQVVQQNPNNFTQPESIVDHNPAFISQFKDLVNYSIHNQQVVRESFSVPSKKFEEAESNITFDPWSGVENPNMQNNILKNMKCTDDILVDLFDKQMGLNAKSESHCVSPVASHFNNSVAFEHTENKNESSISSFNYHSSELSQPYFNSMNAPFHNNFHCSSNSSVQTSSAAINFSHNETVLHDMHTSLQKPTPICPGIIQPPPSNKVSTNEQWARSHHAAGSWTSAPSMGQEHSSQPHRMTYASVLRAPPAPTKNKQCW